MSECKNILKKSRRILLFFFCLFIGCSRYGNGLEIFYSGNLSGIIEDCVCPSATEGTILNHYAFYKDSIGNNKNSFYISAGNLFAYSKNDKENIIITDIYSLLGYDVITPGRNDFQFIEQMKGSAVSYNIKGAKKYHKIRKDGITVSITGMADTAFNRLSGESIIEHRTIDELSVFIKELKALSDIVIFVSNLESSFEKEVFMKISEIDIFISNTNRRSEAYTFGKRHLVSPGQFGESIGKLIFHKTEEGTIISNSFTKITRRFFKDDPNMKSRTDDLRRKYGIELEEIDSMFLDR